MAHVSISRILVLMANALLIGCGGGPSTGTITPTPAQQSVELSWVPSLSPVIGYNIYRGTAPGGPYPVKLNPSLQPATHFVDNTVLTGKYYYVATSLDAHSVESSYSNEVKAVVP